MTAEVVPTAAALVIGNEILSGKVQDTNSRDLALLLRRLGVRLEKILVIPDDRAQIAASVSHLSKCHDWVFTSGGVGPTHDDVTIEGIARGFGRRVVRHPELEAGLRRYLGDRLNAHHLKMAEVPEGAELVPDANLGFPTILLGNVYILPGIPEILYKKFEGMRLRFQDDPFHLHVIYTSQGESTIADSLNQVVREFPELMLGSYPKIGHPEYMVKLTIESKDEAYARRAFDRLVALLPAGSIVRTE